MDATEEKCANCRFWKQTIQSEPTFPDGSGECHVRAPSVMRANNFSPMTAFPELQGDSWCGEWQSTTKYVVERYVEPPAPSSDVNEILGLLRKRRGMYMYGSPSWMTVNYCIDDIMGWVKEE